MVPPADVLIVGAGVAGLSAARLLGRHGLRCQILHLVALRARDVGRGELALE